MIDKGPLSLVERQALAKKLRQEDDDAAFKAEEKARISALQKSAPEVIWLQVDPEAEQFDGWEAQTWCSDKINETDVKYIRADLMPNNARR